MIIFQIMNLNKEASMKKKQYLMGVVSVTFNINGDIGEKVINCMISKPEGSTNISLKDIDTLHVAASSAIRKAFLPDMQPEEQLDILEHVVLNIVPMGAMTEEELADNVKIH